MISTSCPLTIESKKTTIRITFWEKSSGLSRIIEIEVLVKLRTDLVESKQTHCQFWTLWSTDWQGRQISTQHSGLSECPSNSYTSVFITLPRPFKLIFFCRVKFLWNLWLFHYYFRIVCGHVINWTSVFWGKSYLKTDSVDVRLTGNQY